MPTSARQVQIKIREEQAAQVTLKPNAAGTIPIDLRSVRRIITAAAEMSHTIQTSMTAVAILFLLPSASVAKFRL